MNQVELERAADDNCAKYLNEGNREALSRHSGFMAGAQWGFDAGIRAAAKLMDPLPGDDPYLTTDADCAEIIRSLLETGWGKNE